jgi:hypothetical protein
MAVLALEEVPSPPILRGAVTARRTGTAAVPRIDRHDGDTRQFRFILHERSYHSRKTGWRLHRIEHRNLECYVPFWALAEVFGRSPLYWHRLERSLGRFSLVGAGIFPPAA